MAGIVNAAGRRAGVMSVVARRTPRTSAAARTVRNRRSRARRGCGPIRSRMAAARIATPSRSHPVTGTPAAILIAVRLVVAGVVTHHAHASIDTHAFHCAGAHQDQGNSAESGPYPSFAHDVHFGSVFLPLPVHSISPKGAPAGSATTATWPP